MLLDNNSNKFVSLQNRILETIKKLLANPDTTVSVYTPLNKIGPSIHPHMDLTHALHLNLGQERFIRIGLISRSMTSGILYIETWSSKRGEKYVFPDNVLQGLNLNGTISTVVIRTINDLIEKQRDMDYTTSLNSLNEDHY